jgi:predicted SAM-dependent methyltransferase
MGATGDIMALRETLPFDGLQSADAAPAGFAQRTALNLGCGQKYYEHAVNLDVPTAKVRADIWHDLNVRPWPFDDNSFREVLAYDVVEHLRDVIPTMEEIHRVCCPGATVRITVPHFSCANAFTDPTHLHYFSLFSFDYVTGDHAFYTASRFRTIRREMLFHPTLVNKLIWRLARRYPAEYERRWAWIFPAWFLSFELEVVK